MLLLDINLPDQSGFKFCAEIQTQQRYKSLPVIFLTGDGDLGSKLLGFELGAYDYITKPFEPAELKARVLGILRRGHMTTVKDVHVNGYRVDLRLQKVFERDTTGAEKALGLTPIEFKLLSHFLQNENKVYSRQQLLDLFWGDSVYVSKHTVDTHISSLRKKMGSSGSLLRSIFKQGYLFSNPSSVREKEKTPHASP
ncbi:Phosphate regulon transcriptional regulatory protein PhoB [compost metagenome]